MEIIILLLIMFLLIRKNSNAISSSGNKNRKSKQSEMYSDWSWDEEKQLWIHPLSGDASLTLQQRDAEYQNSSIDFSNAYQAKYLLTKNEWSQYKKLKEIADVKGYVICPKVRLFDIIEPKIGHEKYKTLMYKIQAKHVDFVICDQNMRIKAIIELDDNTHYRKERKQRDVFVDLILRSVGYCVIHTRYITNDVLDVV